MQGGCSPLGNGRPQPGGRPASGPAELPSFWSCRGAPPAPQCGVGVPPPSASKSPAPTEAERSAARRRGSPRAAGLSGIAPCSLLPLSVGRDGCVQPARRRRRLPEPLAQRRAERSPPGAPSSPAPPSRLPLGGAPAARAPGSAARSLPAAPPPPAAAPPRRLPARLAALVPGPARPGSPPWRSAPCSGPGPMLAEPGEPGAQTCGRRRCAAAPGTLLSAARPARR